MRPSLVAAWVILLTLEHTETKTVIQEYDNTGDTRPAFLEPGAPTYRLIQFYDPSSDCNRYQPIFTSLAQHLVNYTSLLQVHSISCTRHESICDSQSIGQLPAFKVYAPNDKFGTPLLAQELHPFTVLDRLGLLGGNSVMRPFVDDHEYFVESETEDAEFLRELELVYSMKRQFAEVDIHLAIEMMMRHFLFRPSNVVEFTLRQERHLKPSVVVALKRWLELLRTVVVEVPDQMTTARSSPSRANLLIKELLNNLVYIAKSEDYMFSILKEHETTTGDWSAGCQMTFDGEISYLCGMWKLLFRAAIGVNQYNLVSVQSPLSYQVVKNIIKSTEEQFGMLCAGDQECSFEVVSSGNDDEDDLQLWIVSIRQKMQRIFSRRRKEMLNLPFSDDEVEATRYPLRSHCPKCWIGDVLNRNVTLAYLELEFGRAMW